MRRLSHFSVNNLNDVIINTFIEAVDDKVEKLEQVVKDTAHDICNDLHNCGVGHRYYRESWSVKEDKGVYIQGKKYIVYNKEPQLPHLLEFGTAPRYFTGESRKKEWKRTTDRKYTFPKYVGSMPAKPHIRPIVDKREQELMEKISNL